MTEQLILKSLLYNGEFFNKALPILEPKYFTSASNSAIFKLLKNHYNTYKTIPKLSELVATVRQVPNETLRLEIVSSLKEINAIDESNNLEFLLDTTVEFVKDAIYTEALILGSDGLTEKDPNKKLKAKALMEEMSKVTIDSDLGLDFDDIETMIKYYQEKLLGIATQHAELNKRLGAGFLPGTLSVIMASSGIGKSLLMTDLISGQIKEGKNVLLISMEMMDKEIMKRVHANAMDLPINDLRNLPEEVIRNAYNNIKDSTGKLYVKDYPNGSFSALMLDSLLESYKIEKDIEFDIIYLDYLGIMKSDLLSPSAGLYSYVKSIVEETRAIAKKREIPIISASQLNRQAVNNTDASNDSVSDSIGTVQTADFILFLLQNEQMKEENLITCKVTKNRFTGRTDQWDMSIDYEHMKFNDLLVQSNDGMTTTAVKDAITNVLMEDVKTVLNNSSESEDDFDIMAELGL